jgi:hypothetical protein
VGNLWLWCRKGPGFWLLQESGLPLLLQAMAIIRLWNLPRSVVNIVLECSPYCITFQKEDYGTELVNRYDYKRNTTEKKSVLSPPLPKYN